jgi:DNA-directed RNA polymerase beta' subunit
MEFYLLSDDEKKKLATYVVNNNNWDINREEAGSFDKKCMICDKIDNCTGHYGLLYLQTIIVHPFFTGKIKSKDLAKLYYSSPETNNYKYKRVLMNSILVPPPGLRSPDDMEWKDRLSKIYMDLIELIRDERVDEIQGKVNELFGSRSKTGIMEYLSSKEGIFRKIVFGKRIESSARSVITGDPKLDPTEVMIPKIIADNMYINCIVDNLQTTYYSKKDEPIKSHILIEKEPSMRKIRNGDLVIINRQPTLSYGSIFTFKVRIANDKNKVIRINPNVTKTFNADFDGDEMNIFCFPQSEDLEKMFIGNFPNHINLIQDSKTREYMQKEKIGGYEHSNSEDNSIDPLIVFDLKGLTVSLRDIIDKTYEDTGLQYMVQSKSKGNLKNVEQMMEFVGKQYLGGKLIGEIKSSYVNGLTPKEYFVHQKASREAVVSTGVKTSDTGYINRKGTTLLSDVVDTGKYIEDSYGIISFKN